MSNVATVQGVYEAFGRGDIPAILDVLADDVEWGSWGDNSAAKVGVPWTLPQSGKQNVVRFFEAVLPQFGGRSYRDEEIHLWTFDDAGKVVGLRHYTDTAKQIAAFTG